MPFNFNDARLLDQISYDLILSDYPRGRNRAKIQTFANGGEPYTPEEVEQNGIEVNYNTLKMTRRLHDARSQMANGLLKPANQFTCRTDMGPKHKRQQNGVIVTKEISRIMKTNPKYFESIRAKIGQLVLHGISPSAWEHSDWWCQRPVGVEDILIPSGTLLGFENLTMFMIRRNFTAVELQKLTRRPGRDPGWSSDMVDRCLAWVDKNTLEMRGSNWPEVWSPEKVAERVKEDGGFYYGDAVPTVDCFDVYGYDESNKESGWVRRIILDSWGAPSQSGVSGQSMTRKTDELFKGGRDDFLYTSGSRKVAKSWTEIVSFQFADLSAVFPARYHSVRSLGFLLFSMCWMDNRMVNKFQESVLEALNQYFEVDSIQDAQVALKLNLINRGFIDKTIRPVKAQDRWQVNANLVELGMNQTDQMINESSGAFSQQRNFSQDKVEKTKFQVMAELNADTAMIGAAMAQAYFYQTFEYRENFRRFLKKDSTDVDVQRFRAAVLRQGVPEEILVPEAWDIEPERVMGGGNKTMELTIAQQLMEWRPSYPPAGQSEILRMATMALTGDVEQTNELVPEEQQASPTVHDTELVFAAIMSGTDITPNPALNALEVAGTMIRLMAAKVQGIMQSGGVGTPQDLQGLGLAAKYTGFYMKSLSADKQAKPAVKQLAQALGNIMNEVKAMAQRQQEMMKKQQAAAAQAQNGNGAPDPDKLAKLKLAEASGKIKLDNMTQSHAARTAQREIEFKQKLQQEREQHLADLEKKDLEGASNIRRGSLKSLDEKGD
jgi:hypothetical protein